MLILTSHTLSQHLQPSSHSSRTPTPSTIASRLRSPLSRPAYRASVPTSSLHTVLGLQGPCSDADEADAAALAESVVLWLSRRRCVSGVGQDVPRRGCDYAILAHHRPRRWYCFGASRSLCEGEVAAPAASARGNQIWRNRRLRILLLRYLTRDEAMVERLVVAIFREREELATAQRRRGTAQ